MATLKEIAAAAGVHVSTASVILNSSRSNTRVGEETVRRVLAAASELGYVANEAARRLRTGRSRSVGFLGGDMRNPFFSELAAALEHELARVEHQLLFTHVAHLSRGDIESVAVDLQQQGVGSMICWSESPGGWLQSKRVTVPVVSIGFTRRPAPGVWVDLFDAIRLIVTELKAQGVTAIGFFAPGSQQESPSVAVRHDSVRAQCRKLKLSEPVAAYYAGESWDLEAATAGAAVALRENPRVEVWIGFNDVASLGLLNRLPQKEAKRVVCFDGTAAVRCWRNAPPRLDLKIPEMAARAVGVIMGHASAESLAPKGRWLKAAFMA